MSKFKKERNDRFDGTAIINAAIAALNVYGEMMAKLGYGDYETLPIMKALIDQGIHAAMGRLDDEDRRRFMLNCQEASRVINGKINVRELTMENPNADPDAN